MITTIMKAPDISYSKLCNTDEDTLGGSMCDNLFMCIEWRTKLAIGNSFD